MECPICNEELEWEDYFSGYRPGNIYRCPNGFKQNGSCKSELFHVAGSFYVYGDDGEIHAGYPC